MSNVTPLKVVHKPDPDVVDILEIALKQAKAGELTAIALVKANFENHIATSWATGYASAPYTTLIGGCTLILKQLTEEWDKETERV